MENILLIIDMQADFMAGAPLSVFKPTQQAQGEAFVQHFNDFLRGADMSFFTDIIATFDTHIKESYPHTVEAKTFPAHCIYGTKGWELVVKNSLPDRTTYLTKYDISLWHYNEDYLPLQRDWRSATVYLTGVTTDICVKMALDGLLERGAKVIVLKDLVKGYAYELDELTKRPEYQDFLASGQMQIQSSDTLPRL